MGHFVGFVMLRLKCKYHNDLQYLDTHVRANNVDLDQTAPEQDTVCCSVCISWKHICIGKTIFLNLLDNYSVQMLFLWYKSLKGKCWKKYQPLPRSRRVTHCTCIYKLFKKTSTQLQSINCKKCKSINAGKNLLYDSGKFQSIIQ